MQRRIPRRPTRATAAATSAALAAVLSGCGTTGGTAETGDPQATDPGSTHATASDLLAHDGRPCPRRLPPDEGAGPAESTSELTVATADRAWTCRYEPDDGVRPDWGGTTPGWERDGTARPVDPEALRQLEPHLAALRPATADRICTMDLGPRWLLVLSEGGDLTGVVLDDFGCRDVRLTDDPFEAPGSEARPAGVLTGPIGLVPAIRALHGAR